MQKDVGAWLEKLEMSEYKELFKKEGFSGPDDVENLKNLTKKELQAMGVTKRGNCSLCRIAGNFRAGKISFFSFFRSQGGIFCTRTSIQIIAAVNIPAIRNEN